MTVVCRLWPSVAPHGAEVPASIWNLPYCVWAALAAETDAYLAQQRESAK